VFFATPALRFSSGQRTCSIDNNPSLVAANSVWFKASYEWCDIE
jgi:hypothetical protein